MNLSAQEVLSGLDVVIKGQASEQEIREKVSTALATLPDDEKSLLEKGLRQLSGKYVHLKRMDIAMLLVSIAKSFSKKEVEKNIWAEKNALVAELKLSEPGISDSEGRVILRGVTVLKNTLLLRGEEVSSIYSLAFLYIPTMSDERFEGVSSLEFLMGNELRMKHCELMDRPKKKSDALWRRLTALNTELYNKLKEDEASGFITMLSDISCERGDGKLRFDITDIESESEGPQIRVSIQLDAQDMQGSVMRNIDKIADTLEYASKVPNLLFKKVGSVRGGETKYKR